MFKIKVVVGVVRMGAGGAAAPTEKRLLCECAACLKIALVFVCFLGDLL